MKTEFDANFGQASAALGFVRGITKTVKTDAYISDVLTYTHGRMIDELDDFIDNLARATPNSLHHVYEWPTGWDEASGNTARGGSPNWSETVGVPSFRLWKHTLTGRGARKTSGYTFLPSVRASPVNPRLVAAGVKENVHIWHWKAPAMETAVHVSVSRRLARTLAFIDKEGEVRFAQATNNGPAGGGMTTGRFTAAYLLWWSASADSFFNQAIEPLLTRNINPQGVLAQAAVRIGSRTRTKSFGISVQQSEQAEKEAQEWVIKKAKKDYVNGPNGSRTRRDSLYG